LQKKIFTVINFLKTSDNNFTHFQKWMCWPWYRRLQSYLYQHHWQLLLWMPCRIQFAWRSKDMWLEVFAIYHYFT